MARSKPGQEKTENEPAPGMSKYRVMIRKSANTVVPVDVPKHEIPVLETLFGEGNVLNREMKLLEEGLGAPVSGFTPSPDEYSRLALKYGDAVVEKVYGSKASKQLEKAME